jgi:anti-sigma-K factor RskA
MTRFILLMCLALAAGSAHALPPRTEVTDPAVVLFLFSDSQVLARTNTAVTRHQMKLSKIISTPQTEGVTYQIWLRPQVPPPPGIHADALFQVHVSGTTPGSTPSITGVGELIFQH